MCLGTGEGSRSWEQEGRLGRGCGAVGRAIASDTRDLRFDSSHFIYYQLYYVNCIE